MYLKSLTLRGFKSFASSTTLNFEPGITCVVGPNGSGKSNVVDALAWVMGEQGAKSLRGGKMEDVIFAGTANRAPLGRAEVLLTIDNTDGALPIEYSEVTISRTMFRNGGSDYAINGHASRLLDVQELLSDSGIGQEMHVIVGQGQLDAILSATPEGRRGFIEEAAGVLKHRKRKEKALRKLESTEANLNRLADLVAEIRRQLKPLSRQAEGAQSAERDLAAAQPRFQSAQETWYGLAGLRERITSTISIAAERIRHADELPIDGRPGRDPDALEAEAATEARAEEGLRAEVTRRERALAEATERRMAAEQEHAESESRLAALVRAASDRREGLARLTGQVGSLRSRTENAAEQMSRLTVARDAAMARANEATRAFQALESNVAGLEEGEIGLDSEYEAAEAALTRAMEDLAALLSLIHISEPTRRTPISYAVF